MGYRNYCIVLMMFCLAGCAHVCNLQKQTMAKGQAQSAAGQFQGGDFPYYHWASPMVQDVLVPAHIANGVFIPEHKEPVIIKPGEWAQSPATPIASQKETYERTTHDVGMDGIDITPLPYGNGASRDGS